MKTLPLLSASVFALLSFNTSAQSSLAPATSDEELEKIEVTGTRSAFGATKTNVPIVELARSVSIETLSDLKDKGAFNLSQTVTYMAGVAGETYGFATRGDAISSRGLSIPRYRDSIQELFGSYNSTRAEVYTLEQVELLKGPASVLYGQGSPGGLVNYVSKTPGVNNVNELILEYGSFNKKQVNVDVGSRLTEDEKWLGRVVGIYRDADTQVDYVNDDTRLLMPSVSYSPSDATRLTVIGLFQDTNSDTAAQFVPIEGTLEPLADGSYLPDQDVYAGEPGFNKYDTKSSQLTVLGEHAFNDTTELTFTALWRDGEADYHQAWPLFTGTTRYINAFLGAPVVGTETTVARTFYTADNTFKQQAVDIRLSKTFDTGAFEHVILAGVQYQDVETDNNFSYYTDGGVSAGDFRYVLDLANPVYTGAPDQAVFDALYTDGPLQTVKDVGLYLSDQIAYDNWRITLGVRHDSVDNDNGSVSQDDSQTSYSAGVLYKFANGLSPYVSYAESFETVVGLDMLGNQLEPETGRQYEAGIKYAFNAIPGFVTLAWYDIEIANLPNPNALPVTASQQQGIATINGVELESRIVLGEFTAELNASVMDAQDPNGFELPGQPDSNASLWLTWEPSFGDGLRMGAGLRYVGQSVAENTAVRYATPDYTLADLMLEKPLSDNLIARLNVRNLTDKEYLTSCLTRGDCFPGVRRNINASLTYQF